jgi:hypothetical protein
MILRLGVEFELAKKSIISVPFVRPRIRITVSASAVTVAWITVLYHAGVLDDGLVLLLGSIFSLLVSCMLCTFRWSWALVRSPPKGSTTEREANRQRGSAKGVHCKAQCSFCSSDCESSLSGGADNH